MEILNTKKRFIELRAQGYSFDKIAKELRKSKQTLLDWNNELKEEIANAKALELEALLEGFYLLKEHRLKTFGGLLLRIKTELESRDLKDISTDRLLDLFAKYYQVLKEEIVEPSFKSSSEIIADREEREYLQDLTGEGQEKLKAV